MDAGELIRMKTEVDVFEAPRNSGRVLTEETRRLFELGAERIAANDHDAALAPLREAVGSAPEHAQLRSLLGVAIARVERNFEKARGLCESATKQEFFNPDLYFNLSRVYLEFGRRAEALRYLRRGQMIDPGHALIRESIGALGKRKSPIVPFLARRHAVNRALGTARNFVLNGFSPR